MRTAGKLLLTVSLTVAAAGVAEPTKASLINEDVTLTCSGNNVVCGGTVTVGANAEFTAGLTNIPILEIDLDESSITMTNVISSNQTVGIGIASFKFSDLNSVGQTGGITSATISTSDAQLGKSFNFSFTDDSFSFVFDDETGGFNECEGAEPVFTCIHPGGSITANLSGSVADVPIPATLGLLVTGLVGTGLLARRRRDI